jgi:hypothetical protein
MAFVKHEAQRSASHVDDSAALSHIRRSLPTAALSRDARAGALRMPYAHEMSRGFSLFDWTLDAAAAEDVPMRKLGGIDAVDPRGAGRFTAGVRAMLHWCRLNEQLVIERHAARARVLAGFERFSRVRPVIARYRRLASAVDGLVVFGYADESLALDVVAVDVGETHPLAREWFLIIDAPDYTALLVARDLHGFGPTGPLAGRRFKGITVHDSRIVRSASDALIQQTSKLPRRVE